MKNSSKQITKSKAASHATVTRKTNAASVKAKDSACRRYAQGTSAVSSQTSAGPKKKAATNRRKKSASLKAPPALKRSPLKNPTELLNTEAAKKKKNRPFKVKTPANGGGTAGKKRGPTTPSTISTTTTEASSTGTIQDDLAGFGLTTPSPTKKSRSKSPRKSAARTLSVEFKATTSTTKKDRVESAKKQSPQANSEEPIESKENNKKVDAKFSCANIKWTDHLSVLDAADYHLDTTHSELLEMPHKKLVKLLLGAFSPKQMVGALVPICIDRRIDWRLVDQDKHFLTRRSAESMLMKILFGKGTL